jgi:hypothetical protein
MLDAHLNQALENGDRVFGNELLKGDQERTLDSDAATDLGETVYRRGVISSVAKLKPSTLDRMNKTYALLEEPPRAPQIR